MLDNIRRKFSYSNVKVFYNKICDLGRFEDLIYHKGVGSALPRMRCTQEKSTKSFRYIYKTSETVKLKEVEIKVISCPAGKFTMGHDEEQNNKLRLEVIERPFLLGETEVTQELYQAVMGTNPSNFQNDSQNPVEKVLWDMAILFCNELSRLQGLELCYTKNSDEEYDWLCDFGKNGYRLPTEKEWEYAAKAGTENEWAGTNKEGDLGEYAVFAKNSEINGKYQTHPVKSKLPNEWGFYDMSGNVIEWCWDKYRWDMNASENLDPSAERVYRGGGWSHNASILRSARRGYGSPSLRHGTLGFRVCRSIVN